jgi:hypothetical protein
MLYSPRDVRFEEVPEPRIIHPTDAIIRLSATCICGSDLWPYRGLQPVDRPMVMGHEYCGIVEEVGSDVRTVRPGQFVVGSFCLSDNTCPHCRFGFQSSCVQREFMTGAEAPYARVPLADGTLVATAELPPDDLIPSLLATSDVLGTGPYAADAAEVKKTQKTQKTPDREIDIAKTQTRGALMERKKGCIDRSKTFDEFLASEGILAETEEAALKQVIAEQIKAAMQTEGLSKTDMAARMKTTRRQLDRLLDPNYSSVTLMRLRRAAAAMGRQLRVERV